MALSTVAAKDAETLPGSAPPPRIAEGTILKAVRDGSAGGILAPPLPAVVGGPGPEAVVHLAAEVLVSAPAALVAVLVLREVRALEEGVVRISRVPDLVATGAELIATVIDVHSGGANNEGVIGDGRLHNSIASGPSEVAQHRHGTAERDVIEARLAADFVVVASLVVAEDDGHPLREKLAEDIKAALILLHELNRVGTLGERRDDPDELTRDIIVVGHRLEPSPDIEHHLRVDREVGARAVRVHVRPLPRLRVALALAILARVGRRGEAEPVRLHDLDAAAPGLGLVALRTPAARSIVGLDQIDAAGAVAVNFREVDVEGE